MPAPLDQTAYRHHVDSLSLTHRVPEAVGPTYLALLDYVTREEFRGACHAVTAILHVLLRNQGIVGRLVTGELRREQIVFNHSWWELDGKVFDIAVALPLQEELDGAPVFASADLLTLSQPYWTYGFKSGLEDDPEVWVIKQQSFVEFMDNAPHHRNGLWYIVQKVGQRLKLKLSLNRLREFHVKETWEVR